MLKSKKIIALSLSLTMLLSGGVFTRANAFEEVTSNSIGENIEETHPMVDTTSIKVDKSDLVAGDTMKLSLKVLGDPSYIRQITVVYLRPGEGRYWQDVSYNKESDSFEGTRQIGEYTIPGIWEITEILVRYSDGTEQFVYLDPENVAKFDGGKYTVSGTDGDVFIPTIDDSTLKVNQKVVSEGDRLLISIKAFDDKSGVESLSIMYREPEYKSVQLSYNSELDVYEGYIDVDKDMTLGEWKVSQIYIEDWEQNNRYYNNLPEGTNDNDVDLSGGNFTVVKNNTIIDEASIKVDKSEVVAGDIVKISYKVNEDLSKISRISTVYSRAITGHWYWVDMEYNKETGCFEGYKTISDYTEEGTWTIGQIHINYNDDTRVYVSNVKDPIYDEGEDLSGGNFNVIGTDSDIEKPVLHAETLKISKSRVTAGEMVKINVKITDDKSGIGYVSVMYRTPVYRDITLEYNSEEDVYEGYFYVDEATELGQWEISQIYISDNVENYVYYNNNPEGLSYNDVNLSAGNFTVLATNEKPIISGAEDVTIPMHSSFDKMTGVTASDFEDGEITDSITVDGDVDIAISGEYTLVYKVTDNDGNEALATRVVTVMSNEKPVITGIEETILRVGDKFNPMDGVTAYDAEDGNITSKIVVSGRVKTWLVGNYNLTYEVTDNNGNTATESRIVRVTLGVKDLNGDGHIDVYEFLKWLLGLGN